MKKSYRPYREQLLNENTFLRKFSRQVSQSDLVWHRDPENRIIEVLSGNDWLFQRDNELPFVMSEGDRIEISKGEYHRILKGRGDLYIKIYKEGKKLSPKQKKIASAAPPEGEITGADFEALRKNKKNEGHPEQYGAPKGSKRDRQLNQTKADLASGDPERIERAYRRRDRMELKHRKNESRTIKVDPDILREYIEELVEEQKLYAALEEVEAIEEGDALYEYSDYSDLGELDEKRKRRKKRKKRKKRKSSRSGRTLSKAVKKSLDKKADRRCLTRGSVYAEFRAGLGAYYSSGSRKGMAPHQWAHARVNSANPSKSWAKVKKRKKCPKKKKKK